MHDCKIYVSDCDLILLSTNSWNRTIRYPPFKFKAKCLIHESFLQLVKQRWTKFVKSSSTYQLARKIELLKKEITIWKKSFYDNVHHYIDQIKKDLIIQQTML